MSLRVTVPRSKHSTQRALILAAQCRETSMLELPRDCRDVRLLAAALVKLGVEIKWGVGCIEVRGPLKLTEPREPILLGSAVSALSSFVALSLLVKGRLYIDGEWAAKRQSLAGLVTALQLLGIEVRFLESAICPPVELTCPGTAGGKLLLPPGTTARHLSALMLVAPSLARGLEARLDKPRPSHAAIESAITALAAFGGKSEWRDDVTIVVEPGHLRATRYAVETDLSAAAAVMTGAWIAGRRVHIKDARDREKTVTQALSQLSTDGPRVIDVATIPDIVSSTVVAALFSRGETRIVGLDEMQRERLRALVEELAKMGARITGDEHSLTIRPGPLAPGVALDPRGDPHLAMAFGLLGLRVPKTTVVGRACVGTFFPDFWNVLERMR